MLLNLVLGVESSPFILIKDCYDHSGFALLKAMLKYRIQHDKTVELFCYEYSPDLHINALDDVSKINVHDGYTDPLEWNCVSQLDSSKLCGFDLCSNLRSICQSSGKRTLIIDSLSYVILNIPVHDVYKTLNSCLKRNVSAFDQIIACVHSDVHEEIAISKFEHLATSVLDLTSDSPTTCTVVHKKLNGKIVKETERYFITENFAIDIRNAEIKQVQHQQPADPTADLTFNLNLKDDEKTARQDLVLPYVKSGTAVTEGTIYFQPDDFEDPDDDLDI